jgi:hypothetical protein
MFALQCPDGYNKFFETLQYPNGYAKFSELRADGRRDEEEEARYFAALYAVRR